MKPSNKETFCELGFLKSSIAGGSIWVSKAGVYLLRNQPLPIGRLILVNKWPNF